MSDSEKIPKEKPRPGNRPKESMECLNVHEKVFCDEYLVSLNAYTAAKAAGYSDTIARTRAYQWVKNPEIKPLVYARIREGMKDRSDRTGITADKVLERYWQMATADPNELTQVNHNACRHCYGTDHKFQWIDAEEYEKCLSEAERQQAVKRRVGTPDDELEDLPDDEGGYGFDPRLDPVEECPRCFGQGILDLYLADTRNLSPHGQALYAGVKQTKAGIEIIMHDQKAALDQVARHLGMFNDKLTLKGDAQNPLELLLQSLPGSTLKPVEE